MTRPFVAACATCIVLFIGATTGAQETDAEKFALGRIALDTYKDCPAALSALNDVSAKTRNEPLWILYVAKTLECLGNMELSLEYYVKYAAIFPGQLDMTEKIASLRYLAQKKKKERDNLEGTWTKSDVNEYDGYRVRSEDRLVLRGGGPIFVGTLVETSRFTYADARKDFTTRYAADLRLTVSPSGLVGEVNKFEIDGQGVDIATARFETLEVSRDGELRIHLRLKPGYPAGIYASLTRH